MHESEKPTFATALEALASTFRVEPSPALYEGYWMSLDDLPLASVLTAIKSAMRQCERMPSGAELRKLTGEMGAGTRAVHAFGALSRAIRQFGAYGSVDFDDAVINATVRNLGGWQRVCSMEAEEFDKWFRRDFERVYSQLCATGISAEAGKYLAGVHEQNNTAKNFAVTPPNAVATGLPPHRPGVVRELSAPERLVLEGRREESVADVANVVALVAGKRSA